MTMTVEGMPEPTVKSGPIYPPVKVNLGEMSKVADAARPESPVEESAREGEPQEQDSHEVKVLRDRIANLEANLEVQAQTLATKQHALDAERRAAASLRRELADFKDQVVSVADDYGKRYEMCEKLDDALEELGLRIPTPMLRVRATIDVSFWATPTRTFWRSGPDISDVGSCLSVLTSSNAYGDVADQYIRFDMDGDFEDEPHGITVEDVKVTSYDEDEDED